MDERSNGQLRERDDEEPEHLASLVRESWWFLLALLALLLILRTV